MSSHSDRVATLVARFPRIFKGCEPQLGITTGAGWNTLLIELLEKIDQLLDDTNAKQFSVAQIKEKFGGLRVYYDVGDSREMVLDLITSEGVISARRPPQTDLRFPREAIDQRIAQAAALARVTCELCGRPGMLRRRPWIRVLCDACDAATGDSHA